MLLLLGTGSAHAAFAGLPVDWNATPAVPTPATIEQVPALPGAAPAELPDAAPAPAATPAPTPAPILVPAVATVTADAAPADAPDARELECVAKVIVHEAGNQPRVGQVAVAQVIRARMKSGRFADTACGVVKQRGQFFNVDSYQPSRVDARWTTAMQIATETLGGTAEDVAPGALFFHSAGAAMPSRIRVAQIGGHTFYR